MYRAFSGFSLLLFALLLTSWASAQDVRVEGDPRLRMEVPEALEYDEFSQDAVSQDFALPETLPREGPLFDLLMSESLDDREAALGAPLQLPAPSYLIEAIEIYGNASTSKTRILDILGIAPDEMVDLQTLEASRVRLSTNAAFESVEISLASGSTSFRLRLIIFVKERLKLKLNEYHIGLSSKSKFWLGLDTSYLNAFGLGHIIRSSFVASAADEYSLKFSYILPKLASRAFSFVVSAYSLMATEALFDNDAKGGVLSLRYPFEQISSRHVDDIAVQRHGASLLLAYRPQRLFSLFISLQSQALMRDHRNDASLAHLDDYLLPGTSVMSSATVGLRFNNRDAMILPQRGHFAALRIQGSYESLISDYQFLKFEAVHQSNFPLVHEHTLRLQTFAGLALGEPPFLEKFFYGDFYDFTPERIQNFNPSSASAFDLFKTGSKTLSYEDFLVSLSFEYAWQRLFNRYGIERLEFFAAVTGIYADSFEHSSLSLGTDPKGASRSSFPIDLSFNLGLRLNTDLGLIRITLAHFFNLVPR